MPKPTTPRKRIEPPMFTLRAAREMRGLTQKALAERTAEHLGKPVDEDTISNLERGWKRASPPLLHAVARALGVDPLEARPAGASFAEGERPRVAEAV